MNAATLDRILRTAPLMHAGGPCAPAALEAIARHSGGAIEASAETGCGASTLLFSHLSRRHTVFTLGERDDGYAAACASPLLERGAVTFVLGPTHRTLPAHAFTEKLDAVLLDGPHAYPFPQLEYCYLYPHLREGALLAIDDLEIRAVFELYRFLRSEAMFEFLENIGRTAFFRRTRAPAFDPGAHAWHLQGRGTLLRFDWRDRLRALVPERLRRRLRQSRRVSITAPGAGESVGASGTVRGRARVPAGHRLWLFARRSDQGGWWPQCEAVAATDGSWSAECRYGEPRDAGYIFEIACLLVDEPTHAYLLDWLATGSGRPIALAAGAVVRRVVRAW